MNTRDAVAGDERPVRVEPCLARRVSFGDVKRLTMPTSPWTKSGSGLPTSPTRGDERAPPAKAVSPFYSTRMKDTSETSAATDLFRKGAEQIVLDHDKQAKLANLIKAVTVQKQALTEEREQASRGSKPKRQAQATHIGQGRCRCTPR